MNTVLVIEDEQQTRNIFVKCLTFEGFKAYGASNGSEGIQLAQKCHPDLVVCDIMMPDMDGYSVLSTLRRSPLTAAIPLIFLTAKVTMADLRRGMELGADDYLTKPCTVEQFLSAITSRLKRHAEIATAIQSQSKFGIEDDATATQSPDSIEEKTIFPDCPKLARVFQFIENHYCDSINLSDVAKEVGYSPAYLTNLVQEETGLTIKRWIIERRMAQARLYLKTSEQPIRQIAAQVGYNDSSYFTRQFRQFHGVSPQAWRQESWTE
ncbi:response regulator transcription factor [Leptolyngbya iicbica]|uniref:DNA-binding response regulator n=2 Tax=Cyanophyceae TaxID=3028117 RepID=A0A4Q7EGG7_9CYAN|nr:response regulator [Leptolyngbya sp. LK]RZM82177.1 DNA-binding response regulator [Leptolyngbya sp. LK]